MAESDIAVADEVSEPPLLETKLAKKLLAMTSDELEAYHIAQARRIIADGKEYARQLLKTQVNAMAFGPIVKGIIQTLIRYPSFAEPTQQFLDEKLTKVSSAAEVEGELDGGSNVSEAGN